MTLSRCVFALVSVFGLTSLTWSADDPSAAQEVQPRYTLTYKFQAGETVWHEVEHNAISDTTINGSQQSAETTTTSVKVWQIQDVTEDGQITLVHSVNSMQMRTKISGRAEVSYDSTKDEKPPKGYENAAKSIGVPLVELTIDNHGKVIQREVKSKAASQDIGNQLIIPLPADSVMIGDTWKAPCDFDVTMDGGGLKRIKARHLYELKNVRDQIAEIAVAMQILSPVDDPKLEVQAMQRVSKGTIHFDLKKGRVADQELKWDERVVGFAGAQSAMKFEATFLEKLVPAGDRQVRRTPVSEETPTPK